MTDWRTLQRELISHRELGTSSKRSWPLPIIEAFTEYLWDDSAEEISNQFHVEQITSSKIRNLHSWNSPKDNARVPIMLNLIF